jgi:hypothetical protein
MPLLESALVGSQLLSFEIAPTTLLCYKANMKACARRLTPFWFGFCLCLAMPSILPAADVSDYGVVKSIQYQQTNDLAPAPLATNAYVFNAFVVASTNNVVTNATVKVGTNAPVPLTTTNTVYWLFQDPFNSQAALDNAYPAGSVFSPVNYTLTMSTTNDGIRSGSVNFFLLILAVSYPTTPQLTKLAAAQTIDTTRDFSLAWDSLGGSTIAVVQLTILDAASNVVFASPAPFQAGALNGTSTGYVIPAYNLPAGTNLQGHLTIGNPGTPNTNSYPGATGVAALAKDTQFPLATRPAPRAPLLSLRAQASQAVVQLSGESNRLYELFASSNLLNWSTLYTTDCPTAGFTYTDPQPATNPARFYRAKVGQ